jgi:hypothetical protein
MQSSPDATLRFNVIRFRRSVRMMEDIPEPSIGRVAYAVKKNETEERNSPGWHHPPHLWQHQRRQWTGETNEAADLACPLIDT